MGVWTLGHWAGQTQWLFGGPLEWWDQRTLTAGLSRPAAGVGVGAWIWEMGESRLPAESITASTEAGAFGSRRTRGSVFPTTARALMHHGSACLPREWLSCHDNGRLPVAGEFSNSDSRCRCVHKNISHQEDDLVWFPINFALPNKFFTHHTVWLPNSFSCAGLERAR